MTNKIFSAILQNDYSYIQYYISLRKNINILDENQYSLLHLACRYKQINTLNLLLSNKINIDLLEQQGNTALHIATQINFIDGVEFLLKANAKTDILNIDGNTPFHIACTFGSSSLEIFKLLQPYSNIELSNSAKFTPLHLAAAGDKMEYVQSLINLGADLNVVNVLGDTPLHLAIRYDCFDISQALIQAGTDISIQNNENLTPLQLALQNNSLNKQKDTISLLKTYESYYQLNNEIEPSLVSSKKIKI